MKVLHVTEAASAGVLTSVTTLARMQAADPAFDRPVLAYVPRADSPDAAAIGALVGDGVELRQWSPGPRGRIVRLTAGMVRTMHRERFDVIHLHSSRAGLLGRLVAAPVGARSRVVYSPHCFSFDRTDIDPLRRALFLRLERSALRLGRALVLVSDSEARTATALLPGSRTATVHNRVALPQPGGTPAAPTTPGPDARPTVVHIGRIAPQKRPALFGEVAARVRAQGEDVRFLWIGDGDRDLLQPPVEVTGWLDAERVRARTAQASLVLFTSAGEGLPMALLEAQALGVPVVASRVPGVTDLVHHGRTGLLGDTAEELTRAALTLLHDEDARRRLGYDGADHVRRRFDASRLAADSLAAYRTLLTEEETER
ncbi:glycosyltransferase [Brachybacterium epidermidis]|uniref:glycosyltransferase n=1 Tax=Brachybacterium epidermidis TaxID=2781983 RepID=UPI00398EF691